MNDNNCNLLSLFVLSICAMVIGFFPAPLWFLIAELLGILALIGAAILPVPVQDQNAGLNELRIFLFCIGSSLAIFSLIAATPDSPGAHCFGPTKLSFCLFLERDNWLSFLRFLGFFKLANYWWSLLMSNEILSKSLNRFKRVDL